MAAPGFMQLLVPFGAGFGGEFGGGGTNPTPTPFHERERQPRGPPGEVFGLRQSGAPALRFTPLALLDARFLLSAREAADALLREDPELERHPGLLRELERRCAAGAVVGATDAKVR